ncbi:MAG: hypothetical protein PVJ34_21955 [Anaerolineae bacterium]
MTQIHVQIQDRPGGYNFDVTVGEGGSFSRHRVTLDRGDYERLAAGRATPEELVEESFRFLLERESKESILGAFDLMVISRYFPSYEAEIGERLKAKT